MKIFEKPARKLKMQFLKDDQITAYWLTKPSLVFFSMVVNTNKGGPGMSSLREQAGQHISPSGEILVSKYRGQTDMYSNSERF